MPVRTDFRCSRLVIVESLEPTELKTGRVLAEYVRSLDSVRSSAFPVEYRTCQSVIEFRTLLHQLTDEIRTTNHIPLLHVECHGDAKEGLEFANGSALAWAELSSLLVEMNRATRFNLVATFAACYGGHFIGQLSSEEPSPVYAMVAPTETVDPGEVLAGSRLFYATLFSKRDAGVAVDALVDQKLSSGTWFAQHAERWFERVTLGYVENYCNRRTARERSQRLYQKLKSEGTVISIGNVKRMLVQANRLTLLNQHFNAFFMVASIPENRHRFEALRSKMQHEIDRLRATGRYLI